MGQSASILHYKLQLEALQSIRDYYDNKNNSSLVGDVALQFTPLVFKVAEQSLSTLHRAVAENLIDHNDLLVLETAIKDRNLDVVSSYLLQFYNTLTERAGNTVH